MSLKSSQTAGASNCLYNITFPPFPELLPSDTSKVILGATIGVAAVAGAGYLCYNHVKNTPPKKWRKVGELSELIYYPIKSCGAIRAQELECSQLGLNDQGLGDRIFMVVNLEKRFVNARQQPKMLLIHPRFENGKMILSAPNMPDIEVDFEEARKKNPIKCVVWGQQVPSVDCGDEVAKWMSQFIFGEEVAVRLVYHFKNQPTREVAKNNRKFPVTSKDRGSYQDETSYMLLGEGSVEDLNSRIEDKVTALQMRPNFVVKGPKPFEEDKYEWVKIGEDVVFKYCQPCLRCVFTTIDPERAERHPEGEPLKTLKSYRKFKAYGESPQFGIHLGVKVAGKVKIGDAVYVGEK